MATRYFALTGGMSVEEAIDAVQGDIKRMVLTAGCSVGVYGIAELENDLEREENEQRE